MTKIINTKQKKKLNSAQRHHQDQLELQAIFQKKLGLGKRTAQFASRMLPTKTSIGQGITMGRSFISGQGDYKVTQNACIVPGFTNSDSTVITHREYITDVKAGASLVGGSTAFNIEKYPLNPGDPDTFPWLASIAANYEEYDIQGMVFAYVATSGESVASTNTALGTVILATEYDPTKPDFVNKQAMENYSFASSAKPSSNILHAVECAKVRTPVKQLYVRVGPNTGADLRWTDFGNFYIASVGCPAVGTTLGELWVTYKVKLIKPRLPTNIGYGGQIQCGHLTRTGVATATPMGTATVYSRGPLEIEIVGTNEYRFRATPNQEYLVNHYMYGTTTSFYAITVSGGVTTNTWKAGITILSFANSATDCNAVWKMKCTNTDTDGYINVVAPLTALAASMDIVVSQTDETL